MRESEKRERERERERVRDNDDGKKTRGEAKPFDSHQESNSLSLSVFLSLSLSPPLTVRLAQSHSAFSLSVLFALSPILFSLAHTIPLPSFSTLSSSYSSSSSSSILLSQSRHSFLIFLFSSLHTCHLRATSRPDDLASFLRVFMISVLTAAHRQNAVCTRTTFAAFPPETLLHHPQSVCHRSNKSAANLTAAKSQSPAVPWL